MRRLLLPLLFLLPTLAMAAPVIPPGAGPTEDALAEALALVGWSRADLGYRPKGYWNRYPDPNAAAFKLRAFDDLFAEPLMIYDYTRTMANAAGHYLDPAYAMEDEAARALRLYHLTYLLGVDRLIGGFRNYAPNLAPAPAEPEPLVDALAALFDYGGRPLASRTFGQGGTWPPEHSEEAAMLATLPLELQGIMSLAIRHWLEAAHWRDVALRNCDPVDLQTVFEIRDLGQTQGDGQVFYPAVMDVAEALDWQSLGYAWLKAAAATGILRESAGAWLRANPEAAAQVRLDLATPAGRIVINSTDHNLIAGDPITLFLDLGGRDRITASVGGTASLQMPVAIAVSLGGPNYYGHPFAQLTQGAGLLGVGVLWDASGAGSRFEAQCLAQGAGQFGAGLLLVEGGEDDEYHAVHSAQGAGYLGIGLALDQGGADRYHLTGGEGQGFGGIGGIGVCANRSGDDSYYAEPVAIPGDPRADYHSDFKVNVSNAQGVGSGRRGDGSDGHAWAGGLGAIIDLAGADRYLSGNFSLGTGYWYGIGLVWDGAGHDAYSSVYFTQGSGAHFCIGALIDEGDGNDTHLLRETAGAALGFGWDFTTALFLNAGGDDHYRADRISFGCAQIRSNAFFFDLGGDDRYEYTPGLLGFGAADWRDDYATPHPLSPYMSYAPQLGLFLELGGTDRYVPLGEGSPGPMADGTTWLQPSREDPRFGWQNYGIGIDRESGSLWERTRWFLTE